MTTKTTHSDPKPNLMGGVAGSTHGATVSTVGAPSNKGVGPSNDSNHDDMRSINGGPKSGS